MDVTICVGTFGSRRWIDLAHDRALPSAYLQGVPVVYRHEATLADARNAAIRAAATEFIVVLDADDELAPGYIDAMAHATGDLRAPALVEVQPDGTEQAVPLTGRDIEQINPCCIGTAIRRETALDCGGFPVFPAFEDWALFLRAHRRGATIEHVPTAIYRAFVNPKSRNRTVAGAAGLHRRIREWA